VKQSTSVLYAASRSNWSSVRRMIYVPANTEIALEGTTSVSQKGREGLFGEMHGYSFLDKGSMQPLYQVDAITYRKNPILPISVPGRATGPNDTQTMIGTLAKAEIRQLLQDNGLPVKEVFALYESQVIWAAVQFDRTALRSIQTNAKELCGKTGNLVFRHKCGMQIH
jgi:phenacrylate decarboxylase